ncbi:MAG: thiamine-phosphate pyrophosphorylase [Candidatus Omnitrophota bacterium]
MLKQNKLSTANRVIDANINRLKEGLRVCEEITRFILNNRGLTLELKKLRHEIDSVTRGLAPRILLLKERMPGADVGRSLRGNELKRGSLKDVFFANIQRVKESTRVLEEFSKLINVNSALKFKRIRYKIYEIEKKTAEKISPVSYL